MAGRSLNPATHRRLGGPLPRLLPNGPRPHPRPPGLSPGGHAPSREYPVLAWLSPGYPGVGGRLVTCYSPVRHSTRTRGCFLVRLACVRHAASVHPEPGSNSPFERGPVLRAPDQTDSVPVWKCCLSIRTAASEMRRIKINVKDRNDGSLFPTPMCPSEQLVGISQSTVCSLCVDSIRFSRSPRARGPPPRPAGINSRSVRREEVYYALPLPLSTGFSRFFREPASGGPARALGAAGVRTLRLPRAQVKGDLGKELVAAGVFPFRLADGRSHR